MANKNRYAELGALKLRHDAARKKEEALWGKIKAIIGGSLVSWSEWEWAGKQVFEFSIPLMDFLRDFPDVKPVKSSWTTHDGKVKECFSYGPVIASAGDKVVVQVKAETASVIVEEKKKEEVQAQAS